MFRIIGLVVMTVALSMTACTTTGTAPAGGAPGKKAIRGLTAHDAVVATEKAFAKTMADRDFQAFRSFLSNEAIFMSGPKPLRGKQNIADAWKPYFKEAEAPFAWEPERVVVLDSEGLAFSTGPVTGPDGREVGIFSSVWRREPDGVWRIVFDKGSCACN